MFCALTFCRLRRQVSMAVESGINATGTTQGNETNICTRRRQQMAMRTLLLIVASFNLSLLTYTFGNIQLLLPISIESEEFQRFLLFTLSMNSFLNPIIIATRTNDLRIHISTVISKAFTDMCRFFREPDRCTA